MDNIEKKTYKPTEAIRNNAIRGFTLLNKSQAVSTSKVLDKVKPLYESITKSDCSLDDVKRLYTFLIKAEEKYDPLKRTAGGGLDSDSSAFLAAGGTSALAWTRMILKQENILKSYKKDISVDQINTEDTLVGIKLPINKAVNEELMQVLYVAMVPDEADLHGDITTAEEVRKACHNFNQYCMKANLFHLVETNSFSIAESYLAPTDFILGEVLVKAGTWLVNLQIHDDDVWELVKSGQINGVSIGALASVQKIEEDTDE